jgi:hypothetical protein
MGFFTVVSSGVGVVVGERALTRGCATGADAGGAVDVVAALAEGDPVAGGGDRGAADGTQGGDGGVVEVGDHIPAVGDDLADVERAVVLGLDRAVVGDDVPDFGVRGWFRLRSGRCDASRTVGVAARAPGDAAQVAGFDGGGVAVDSRDR